MQDLDRARAALHSIPPDLARAEWHAIGRAAIAAGLGIDDLDAWSAPAENYKGRRDIEAAFRTIKPEGGTGAGTLFHQARQYGYNGTESAGPTQHINHPPKTPYRPAKQAASVSPAEIWERCVPADHADAYIDRKRGNPDGMRVYPATAAPLVIRGQNVGGYLALPCWDGAELQTLQFIPPNGGDKLNLPGASFNAGFFTVGEITDRAYIVEGIGQAWAAHTATGAAAVVCFGAGRMATVAKALKAKHPAARLVIVPDKGKEADAEKIAAAVSGQWVAMPADKPGNYDANDYAAEHGSEALAALLERPQAPPMRFKLLSDAELGNLPPMQWRIKRALPKIGLAAVFGASAAGKSFVVLDMIQAIATGKDWFGHKSTPCDVLYCALEGEAGIAGRVAAYRLKHGTAAGNIRYMVQRFNLLHSEDIRDLAQAIQANGRDAQVVVLDTMSRAAPGVDENGPEGMGAIVNGAKQLQEMLGGLVVLVHHIGKDATRGMRGHTSLFAALDGAIEVRREGERREWVISKSKDGEDGASNPFKLEVVELGIDEDGDAITSCVVRPEDSTNEAVRKAAPPGGGNQRVAWDTLGELLRASHDFGKGEAPPSRPCVTLAAALDAIAPRLPTDAKRQRERAQQAITGLIGRGCLAHLEGWLWTP